MRLYLILLTLAMLYSGYASAYSEKIFDSWVLPNQLKNTSDKRVFSIAPNEDDSKVVVSFSAGGGAIVDKGECKTANELIICYDEAAFSHYNYSLASRTVNKYKIRIEARIAKIDLNRTFEKLNPRMGEQVKVTSIFYNVGDIASNIEFYDNYSAAFEVFLVSSGCELVKNTISWKGTLKSLEDASCTYIIKPVNKTSFSSTAYVSYESNGKKKSTATSAINIGDYALKAAKSIPESIQLDYENDIEIRLQALDNISYASYDVIFPKGIRIVEYNLSNGWTQSGSLFSYIKKMEEGEEALLQAKIKAIGLGNQFITESSSFKAASYTISYKNNITVSIFHTPPYLRLNEEELSPKSELHFFAVNPSELPFYNATIYLDSDINLSQKEFLFAEIPAGGHRDSKTKLNGAAGDYSISWKISYKTKYGWEAYASNKTGIKVIGSLASPLAEKAENKAEENKTEKSTEQKEPQAIIPQIKSDISEERKIPMLVILSPIAVVALFLFLFIFIRMKRKS